MTSSSSLPASAGQVLLFRHHHNHHWGHLLICFFEVLFLKALTVRPISWGLVQPHQYGPEKLRASLAQKLRAKFWPLGPGASCVPWQVSEKFLFSISV